jgi:hypothetical protein
MRDFEEVYNGKRFASYDEATLTAPTIAFDNSEQTERIERLIKTEEEKKMLYSVSLVGAGLVFGYATFDSNILISFSILSLCSFATVQVIRTINERIETEIPLLEYRNAVLPLCVVEDTRRLIESGKRDRSVFIRAREVREFLEVSGNETLKVSLYQLLKERSLDKDHARATWAKAALKRIYPNGYNELEHGYNVFTFTFQDPNSDEAINETYKAFQDRFQKEWEFIISTWKIELGRYRDREWVLKNFGNQRI